MTGPTIKGRVLNSIKALRTQKGLTQQGLADAVMATRQTIIAVEAGKYAPSLELAFRIVQCLEAGFEDVFQYERE